MESIVSVSGGQSSAYIAANYPGTHLLFALVTIEDPRCSPKDKGLMKIASDKLGSEFIATTEDDTILHTMLDLEQYCGQEVHWVRGQTFDWINKYKGGWLPNKLHRYCTVEMKIGFRFGEEARANRMLERTNEDGLLEFKDVIGKHSSGRNKWAETPWQRPAFPLIDNQISRDRIVEYWKDKPVRFAERNNCVGCFHRSPLLLRTMFDKHPEKMEWFAAQERIEGNGNWRSDISYDKIARHRLQHELNFDDFSECDSGHCGL